MKKLDTGIRKKAQQYYSGLVNVLYPPACPVCGEPLPYVQGKRSRLCPECCGKLIYISENRCMKCGKELPDETKEYCYDCNRMQHFYTRGAAVYAYTDGIKQSIYRFKYKNRREYAHFYAEEINRYCGKLIRDWKAQALIPVPLHESKLRSRGYNQAELIADELGRLMGLPVEQNLLFRSRKTTPMKELDEEQRLKNLKNAFHINTNIVKYGKVILVDDIYTTGATIDSCTKELKQHGIEDVYFICLCIGKGF